MYSRNGGSCDRLYKWSHVRGSGDRHGHRLRVQLLPLWLSAVYGADRDADANRDLDTATPYEYTNPDAAIRWLLCYPGAQAADRAAGVADARRDLHSRAAPADTHLTTDNPTPGLPNFAD